MMNALVLEAYGPAESLHYKQVKKPEITAPTQILVKIHASGVNPVDCKVRQGALSNIQKLPFPAVLGIDYSGEIEAMGDKVTGFEKGQFIFGRFGTFGKSWGSNAEYIVVDQKIDNPVIKPENISFAEAAGVGVAATTAYVGLIEHGKLAVDDGKRVLIIGASGVLLTISLITGGWKFRSSNSKTIKSQCDWYLLYWKC